jgi:predicted transcriptional regulator
MAEQEITTGERVNVSAFVDRDVRQELAELARAEDRSMSAIVRRALEHELQRDAEQVEA